MLTRFTLFVVLAGALCTLLLSPTLALSESQQDAAIQGLLRTAASLQNAVRSQAAAVAVLQTRNAALQERNAGLQKTVDAQSRLLSGFSRVTDTTRTDGQKGTELFLSGVNLHVVNGTGFTYDTMNGLGNLIVGYNELRGDANGKPVGVHTGSHNLILGIANNYSSYAGIAAGLSNTISAPYACVTGGAFNTASGFSSTITGGKGNQASGDSVSVLGGQKNVAYGVLSCVSGGSTNTAGGDYSSVSGGFQRTASGAFDWVAGTLLQGY